MCKNFKKFLEQFQSYEGIKAHHFLTQNGPYAPNKNFLEKAIIIIFNHLLAIFPVQNFLKILWTDPKFWGRVSFLGQKWSGCPKQIFFSEKPFFFKFSCLLAYFSV